MDDERPDETDEPATPEEAPVTKETPVTKVSPVVTEADAEAEAAATADEAPALEERAVDLSPLLAFGAFLVLVGLLRRRPLALAAGVGAIWLDQRSELGQRVNAQITSHVRG